MVDALISYPSGLTTALDRCPPSFFFPSAVCFLCADTEPHRSERLSWDEVRVISSFFAPAHCKFLICFLLMFRFCAKQTNGFKSSKICFPTAVNFNQIPFFSSHFQHPELLVVFFFRFQWLFVRPIPSAPSTVSVRQCSTCFDRLSGGSQNGLSRI